MSDAKKIVVVLQDRPDEALRMALGLTLEGDEISVINVGGAVPASDDNEMNIMALGEFDAKLMSVNETDGDFETVSMQDVPAKLAEFDHVLPY